MHFQEYQKEREVLVFGGHFKVLAELQLQTDENYRIYWYSYDRNAN